MKVIKSVLWKISSRYDISDETLDYFLMNNLKLGRFYLLPKIHKRLHNAPGRPVVSNSSYFIENISFFLDFHLKLFGTKSEILYSRYEWLFEKDRPPLPDDLILYTIDEVGLYPNIIYEEGLIAIRKAVDTRKVKTISTDS